MGHEASHVASLGLADADDGKVLQHAITAGAVIVTRDRDFSDSRTMPPPGCEGIIIIDVPETARADFIRTVFARLLSSPEAMAGLHNAIAIVDASRVRITRRQSE